MVQAQVHPPKLPGFSMVTVKVLVKLLTTSLDILKLSGHLSTAISQLGSSQVPGMDGITAEMITFGGAESVKWLKSLFDVIWHSKEVQEDWKNQLLLSLVCLLHSLRKRVRFRQP